MVCQIEDSCPKLAIQTPHVLRDRAEPPRAVSKDVRGLNIGEDLKG